MSTPTSCRRSMTVLVLAGVALVIAVTLAVACPTQAETPPPIAATVTPVLTPTPSVERILFSGCPIDPQSWDLTRCKNWGIYEVNSDGTGLRELLARGDDNPGRLTLSPDGRRLLFYVSVYHEPPPDAPGTERDAYRRYTRRLLDLNTLQERDVPDDIDTCQWVTNESATCTVNGISDEARGLYLINFETGHRTKILGGLSPSTFVSAYAVSPDARYIVFAEQRLTGRSEPNLTSTVKRLKVSGTDQIALFAIDSGLRDSVGISWSRSANTAVVEADLLPGPATFWIITEGGDWRAVAEVEGISDLLGWTNDDRAVLAYACDDAASRPFGRIVSVDSQRTGVETVAVLRDTTGKLASACGRVRLSQDQRSILFWFSEQQSPSEQWGLYVAGTTTAQLKPIVPAFHVADVAWANSR